MGGREGGQGAKPEADERREIDRKKKRGRRGSSRSEKSYCQ